MVGRTMEFPNLMEAQITVLPRGFGSAPASHLILHDAGGASAVIEWRDGYMVISDNPIWVATNSPHLDWHLLNLRNYLTLRAKNPDPVTIEGVQIPIFGQLRGTGRPNGGQIHTGVWPRHTALITASPDGWPGSPGKPARSGADAGVAPRWCPAGGPRPGSTA